MRRRRILAGVVAAVALVAVAVVAWYEIEAHPLGGTGSRQVVQVSDGESTSQVVSALASHGVVGSSLAFRLYLLVHGTPVIQPGGYVLHANQSFAAVRQILAGGPDIFTVAVLPGYTVAEVEKGVSQLPNRVASQFVSAVHGGTVHSPFAPPGVTSLEGLLGVGTYQVLPGETGSQLLGQMVSRFNTQAAAAGLTTASAAKQGMTPYQVITVASIAQKEGYFTRYMGKVARVIYNRLNAGTPLDMTSTVLYSLGQDGGPVTPADQQLDTPYNTYLHAGLTPTPICFPSQAALAAAVSPPPGTWLYFTVVDRNGTTLFSTTYQQQLANERLAQKNGIG